MESLFTRARISRVLRGLVPPALRALANRLGGYSTVLRGPFTTWTTAKASTSGYDDVAILGRVVASSKGVLNGNCRYEQDGVAFFSSPPPAYLLSSLLLAAARNNGRLSVVDVGGALGSHYLRWKDWFHGVPSLRWRVVEQPHFVSAGKELFKDDSFVTFTSRLEDAQSDPPNVIIASSVLQYLVTPLSMLRDLLCLGADVVVLDRTPFDRLGAEGIVTQHVPLQSGGGSYPLWVFKRETIFGPLQEEYELLAEFPSGDETLTCGEMVVDFLGSVWLRRGPARQKGDD